LRILQTEEEEKKRINIRREKRRLQEQLRREKRKLEDQKVLQVRYKQGSEDGTLPNGNVTLRCGRCNMFGHMRTNKSCPLYLEKSDEEKLKKKKSESKMVKKSGNTKISFSGSIVSNIKKLNDSGEVTEKKSPKKHSKKDDEILDAPEILLSDLLLDIWKKVIKSPYAEPFKYAVSLQDAPDYYDVISNPIDLSIIKDKIKTFQYPSAESFSEDFETMKKNCYEYNTTRFSYLLAYVDELCIIVDKEVNNDKMKKKRKTKYSEKEKVKEKVKKGE